MGNKATTFFWIILIGATYHLIRDVMQIAGIENAFTEVWHWNHEWCGRYCDYVTLPLDLFVITGSTTIIRRKGNPFI